jgi:anti-anti-sigma factor
MPTDFCTQHAAGWPANPFAFMKGFCAMRIECAYDEARIILEENLLLSKTAERQQAILDYFADKRGQHQVVVLDLTACSMIDSTGVGMIATLYRHFLKYGTYFRVHVSQNNVLKVLQDCRMTTFLDIRSYPTAPRLLT